MSNAFSAIFVADKFHLIDCDYKPCLYKPCKYEEKWGEQYPIVIKSWRDNWDRLSEFFQYSEPILP